jgi:hypothetical protein
MSFIHGLVVLLLGCSNGGPAKGKPEKPAFTPLHELASASDDPWAQAVWWVGNPGERVEGLIFQESKGGRVPVIAVVDASGVRHTYAVERPGHPVPIKHRVDPDSRDHTSVTAPAAGKRISILGETRGTRMVAIGMAGEGSDDLLRDPANPTLVHPTVNGDKGFVYVERTDGDGGIFRFALADGSHSRIAREADLGMPLSWPSGDERLTVVDEPADGPVKLIVLSPAPDVVPASQALAELPDTLYAVSQGEAGWVAFASCDGVADLPIRKDGDAVEIAGARGDVAAPGACGDGCTILYDHVPSGALREVARIGHTDAVWTFEFSPDTGAQAPGNWAGASAYEGAKVVTSCAAEHPAGAWLQMPRHFGSPKDTWLGIDVARGNLSVGGVRRNGKQHFWLNVPHDDRSIRAQNTRTPMTFEAHKVSRPADEVEVSSANGGITWTQEGARSELLHQDPKRTIGFLDLSDDLSVLVFDDGGEAPGVYWVTLEDGEMTRIAPGLGLTAPVIYEHAPRKLRAAWLTKVNGFPTVVTGIPWTDELDGIWQLGARTLMDMWPTWVPVQKSKDGWGRCSGDAWEIRLDLEAEGGPTLTQGKTSLRVHALWDEGDVTHLLGPGEDDVPRVVASIFPAAGPEGAVEFRVRAPDLPPTAAVWMPQEQTEDMASTGACRKR